MKTHMASSVETFQENSFKTDVLLAASLTVILALDSIGNGFVIYLSIRYKQFHGTSMVLRVAHAIADIGMCTFVPIYIINKFFLKIPDWLTCYFSEFSKAMFLSTIHIVGFISLERYIFFCKPLKHQKYLGMKVEIVMTCVVFTVCMLLSFGTGLAYGREVDPLTGWYKLKSSVLTKVQIAVYILPCVCSTSFSTYRIHTLMRKITTEINKQKNRFPVGFITEAALRKKPIKKSLRSVLIYIS